MRLGLKVLALAIALILVAGVVAELSLWMGGQAKADNGAKDAAVQKSDAPKAPSAKADDDDDEQDADDDDDEDGEDEVKVTIDQVPEAVKAVILAEAGGAAIEEIEKETEHGQTTYEAEWTVGGKEIELKVSADGKVIKKKVEDADNDKDEKGEH